MLKTYPTVPSLEKMLGGLFIQKMRKIVGADQNTY